MLEGIIVLVVCLGVLVALAQFVMPRFGITEEQARKSGCACCGGGGPCSQEACAAGTCPMPKETRNKIPPAPKA
ncbi:MAG: hypothetical protein H0S85_07580 [Desulfovibrionaceae bacterium]|jgi:hypothetical protein|nr:hypothetical protein [Desulfovibrionaceae bacterium]